jgi:heme o synthase
MYQFSEWVRRYYYLTKPGIIMGNALTTIAGIIFATSAFGFSWSAAIAVLVGTVLVIASACVINNIIDRKIDIRMERTKKRSLVTGQTSVQGALIFGIILGVVGFAALAIWTNLLTLIIGVIAYVSYLILYGYSKRHSEHGTLVGAIAGALPPVAGYTALSNQFDLAAIILFIMLAAWQMGHFYAIAIYRRAEYKHAKVPILTVVRGNKPAMEQMVIYIGAFIIVSTCLTLAGYAGATFAVTMFAIGGVWLVKAIQVLPLKGKTLEKAARKLFGFSLLVNLVMCVAIAAGAYLP